jgi:casein kinase II subunit beta
MCERQSVIPVGMSEELRQSRVKVFCPRCEDVYIPKQQKFADVDGAYFGCTFPHLLLQTYPDL